jgi:hypothetical protein
VLGDVGHWGGEGGQGQHLDACRYGRQWGRWVGWATDEPSAARAQRLSSQQGGNPRVQVALHPFPYIKPISAVLCNLEYSSHVQQALIQTPSRVLWRTEIGASGRQGEASGIINGRPVAARLKYPIFIGKVKYGYWILIGKVKYRGST